MALLSKELSGLILPRMSIWEPTWKTATEPLMINFEYAGKVPAKIWSYLEVDTFPCVVKYVDPFQSEILH